MAKKHIRHIIQQLKTRLVRGYWGNVILCMVIGMGILAVALHSEGIQRDNFRRKEELKTLHILTMARNSLKNELNRNLFQLRALVAYISVNPEIDREDFDIFARNLFRQKSDIISFGVAPDMVVKYVYPYAENKVALGLDYSKSPTQRELAFLARDTGQQVMAGPLVSVQGKYVLIAREPVFQAEETRERPKASFWGLVSVLIDAKKLFQSLNRQSGEYEISLRGKDAKGHAGAVFFGNPAAFTGENVILPVLVPGGSWEIVGTPKAVSQDLSREIRLIRLLALGLFIAVVIFFILRVRYISERGITERKLARALIEAEKANRAKSEFLANMSHELRTPLNAIIGFSDLIGSMPENKSSREKISEYARDINESGHHLLEIINQILDLSKVESGNFTTTIESVYLQDVVEQSLRLTRHSMVKGDIDVMVNISDDLPPIQSDERMLRQIFLNLLSNAVKFTPKGGQITLSATERPDGAMEIILTDTGIGMSEDGLRVAMQPFGQVDSYLVRAQQGTGLGLPLVKVFIELLGGRFDIQSEVGVGTEITLIFL